VLTPKEWEAELGQQVRSLRLKQNIDQRQLAERAGVALNAVKRIETGKGATLRSLVKVLRVLNRVEWLRALTPAVSISPVQMLKTKAPRRRASRKSAPISRVHRAEPVAQQQIMAVLSRELAMRAEVSFALVYGSFLSGHDGFRDIDIAVWLDHGADRLADVTLSADLSRLVGVPVDVRVANAAPVAFLFHMLRGRLLTVRDELLLADVMERTARQYHDQAPLLRRATRDAFAA
jgi:transcriptional regulator with XRE-family HTH domain/predicted nucleotidyltransferase